MDTIKQTVEELQGLEPMVEIDEIGWPYLPKSGDTTREALLRLALYETHVPALLSAITAQAEEVERLREANRKWGRTVAVAAERVRELEEETGCDQCGKVATLEADNARLTAEMEALRERHDTLVKAYNEKQRCLGSTTEQLVKIMDENKAMRARCEAAEGDFGKQTLIALQFNGILGDLMDYLEKNGITTLPKSFPQRVDALHDRVTTLAKERNGRGPDAGQEGVEHDKA